MRRNVFQAIWARILDRLNPEQRLLKEQTEFLLNELCVINTHLRYQLLNTPASAISSTSSDASQTRESFDYQWHKFAEGVAMPNDSVFMENVPALLQQMTALPLSWFMDKQVIDIGCGSGRFSYGLLQLGARVTACDQSNWALKRTAELCKSFGENLTLRQVNLLDWQETANFDLVFCFGVVHHTANTYLAVKNVAAKVTPGGKLFLMIYGFPQTIGDFIEVNAHQRLRNELHCLSFQEKQRILIDRFGEQAAHGWFDAISPTVNDLLNFNEIVDLLSNLGFTNIRRTIDNRNHHIMADKS